MPILTAKSSDLRYGRDTEDLIKCFTHCFTNLAYCRADMWQHLIHAAAEEPNFRAWLSLLQSLGN
jgi:hypothetical protein